MGFIMLMIYYVVFVWGCFIIDTTTFIMKSKIHGVRLDIALREFKMTMIALLSFGLMHLLFWTFMLIFGELTIK